MSLSLTGAKMGTGNLVSWRHREADGYGVKYKLYRGDEAAQTEVLNEDLYIIDRTNYEDKTGTVDHFYRLETYDKTGKLIDSEVSRQTWANQTYRIPLQTPASRGGASYTPNDASYCDMDGDGEYEIILKWSPSNEKTLPARALHLLSISTVSKWTAHCCGVSMQVPTSLPAPTPCSLSHGTSTVTATANS